MNKTEYNEIINGTETYKEITDKLRQHTPVIIGWTDEEYTHLDILFTYKVYKESNNYLQRGLRGNELFVSVIGIGSFGFDINNSNRYPGYIGEKLSIKGEITEKLAQLINGITGELNYEII